MSFWARGGLQRTMIPPPAAIDIAHAAQIQHDPLILIDHLLSRIAQQRGFVAENNAAGAIQHGDAVYDPGAKSQLHRPSSGPQPQSRWNRVSLPEILRKRQYKPIFDGHASRIINCPTMSYQV